MAQRLSINLLPEQILLMQKEGKKLTTINGLSILLLLILLFFAAAVLSTRVAQYLETKETQERLIFAQNKVSSWQSKEAALMVLKGRLSSIRALQEQSKVMETFNLIANLASSDLQFSAISIDGRGVVSLTGTGTSLPSLETFLTSLTLPEKTGGMIDKVDLESLSKGRDGLLRWSLRMTSK